MIFVILVFISMGISDYGHDIESSSLQVLGVFLIFIFLSVMILIGGVM